MKVTQLLTRVDLSLMIKDYFHATYFTGSLSESDPLIDKKIDYPFSSSIVAINPIEGHDTCVYHGYHNKKKLHTAS